MLLGDDGGTGFFALVNRPSSGALTFAIVVGVIGWLLHYRAEMATRAARPHPEGDQRPAPLDDGTLEPPAVVGLLTNGFEAPRSAMTATVLDLAARGWIRLGGVDGELVVITGGSGEAGDSLRPYEQQVLNHLAARAFNDVTSAGTLAASQHRLDRRWWLRFKRAVAQHASELGVSRLRYTPLELAPPAACVVLGLIAAWMAVKNGDDEIAVADSYTSRAMWLAALIGLGVLAWRTVLRALGTHRRPTELGAERAEAWMGFRGRLRDRIPPHASVIAPSAQQSALANAVVMGVAEQVTEELPVAAEDDHRAWSDAGGTPHVVHVWYPIRPGYGQHPLMVGAAGLIVFLVVSWVRGFLRRVADGESLQSLLDRVPGQIDLIETVAEILRWILVLPLIWAVWAVAAGVIDALATRERTGMVVRTRRPSDVVPMASLLRPFPERDRFSVYLAVDDGRRRHVTAWLASERTAAPQGAQARIRATPLLGYVRSSEPVGTATRTAV